MRLAPDYVPVRYKLASVLIDRGRFAEAETLCRDLVARHPDLAIAHAFLGAALGHQCRWPEAIVCQREAIRLAPADPKVMQGYAGTLTDVREYPAALRWIHRTVSRAPGDVAAEQMLITTLLPTGRLGEGWQAYGRRQPAQRFRGKYPDVPVTRSLGRGGEFPPPHKETDAPIVYLSATVLGQGIDFRQGLVNIPIVPDEQKLKVQVFTNPVEAGPRDQVTFDVVVTDNQDQPVQGEFSLSVVDKAVLALADPTAKDILSAYYSNQPLGIQTGLSLAVYGGRNVLPPGGLGGGGGDGIIFIREDFPDTAYWNPSLITNSEGRGQVTMTLPDSLTTWHVDVRGLPVDTKVGQAETEIVSTKPLLIRPVTPRFLVSGDHVLMAAVVNNNTENQLNVTVNIQSNGFVLDNPESATRTFDISPNAQARVEWWGTAGLSECANLVFSVTTLCILQSRSRLWWAYPESRPL